MRAYLIRRLLLAIPTIIIVTMLTFLSVRLIPGNVIDIMIDTMPEIDVDRAAVEHALGFDVPIHIQYGRWLINIVQGDLGRSLWSNAAITDEIFARLPISMELGILAILIGILVGLPIGIYSAIRQDTIGDYIGRSIAVISIAIPSFWLGTVVMVFPAIWWNWSPLTQYVSLTDDPGSNLLMFIIPAVIIGMNMSGTTMRMTRTMMLEVLRQDYVRTAWAKGLRERSIVLRHGLRNALIPIVTIIGLQLPLLVGGSVIMEQIFCLPGLGRYMLDALSRRDYPVVSAVNLFIAGSILLANIAVDITYSVMDPRVRYR